MYVQYVEGSAQYSMGVGHLVSLLAAWTMLDRGQADPTQPRPMNSRPARPIRHPFVTGRRQLAQFSVVVATISLASSESGGRANLTGARLPRHSFVLICGEGFDAAHSLTATCEIRQ